jgi:hypothetical protein
MSSLCDPHVLVSWWSFALTTRHPSIFRNKYENLALQVGGVSDETVKYSYGVCATQTIAWLHCKLQTRLLVREGVPQRISQISYSNLQTGSNIWSQVSEWARLTVSRKVTLTLTWSARRPRRRWEDNIKMNIWVGTDCIHLAQNRDQWTLLMKLLVAQSEHMQRHGGRCWQKEQQLKLTGMS